MTPTTGTTLPPTIQVKVYPNPSTGKFDLQLSQSGQPHFIKVYNMQGTCVRTIETTEDNVGIDVSAYGSDIYSIVVPTGSEAVVKKVRVEK